jgi:hypothetical protein
MTTLALAHKLSADKRLSKAVAWLHTMWMEGGQSNVEVTLDKDPPFGDAGRDYSEYYVVTSEPLYRKTLIKRPRVQLPR